MQRNPMTVEGEKALRDELDSLKQIKRPEIIQAIAVAREHGDLKENAEYHAAREQQGFVEGRIQDIESKLAHAQVIDVSRIPYKPKVIFGVTVTIVNSEGGEASIYRIVGDDEADVNLGKISYNSPIAKALIGKEVGDLVQVQTPRGEIEYEIDQVDYN